MRYDDEDYIRNITEYKNNISIRSVIESIIMKIRNEHNINEAANIFLTNNLTFEQLIRQTIRLDLYDIAKLADVVSKIKNLEKVN